MDNVKVLQTLTLFYGAGQSQRSIATTINRIIRCIESAEDKDSPFCFVGAVPPWVKHWELEGWEILDYRVMRLRHEDAVNIVSNLRAQKRKAIILTESPWVISDLPRENVIIFKTRTKLSFPEFETFGASVNKIMMCLFGRRETISNYALERLKDVQRRAEAGEDLDTLIDFCGKNFGDSVEKTLLVVSLVNKQKETQP